MKKTFALIALVASTMTLTACGSSTPDADDFIKPFKQEFANCKQVHSISGKKVNGYAVEEGKRYALEIQYHAEWTATDMAGLKQCTFGHSKVVQEVLYAFIGSNRYLNSQELDAKKTIFFNKTENGWIPEL